MVRASIVEAIADADKKSVIQQFIGQEPVNKYLIRTNMSQPSTWGTEVELFVAAQILQIDIFVYTFGQGISPDKEHLSWGRFPHVSSAMVEEQKATHDAAAEGQAVMPTKEQLSPCALYIDNSTRYHYTPVVGFK